MNNWREILLGYAYFKHKRLISRSRKWTFEQVVAFQASQLKKRTSSFPVSTKKDYLTYPQKYERTWLRFLTKKVSTGGTTGKPFVFRRDLLFTSQKERAYLFDIWKEIGYKPYDLRVIFRGNMSSNGKLLSYHFLENAYIVDPRLLNSEVKEELFKQLSQLPPFYLHVYPSSLFTLINFLGNENFKKLKIKGVLAGSESFPKGQLDHFINEFHIPVAHWYGHSEYAVLAKYNLSKDCFEFYPTYGAVEFIPTEEPDIFSIVATSYNQLGTRFLRYDTQDLCVLEKPSETVSNFLSVKKIIGRSQDFFYDREDQPNAFGPFLFGRHGEFWESFDDIQFQQKQKGQLEVLIVGEKNPQLRNFLTEIFSEKVDLVFIPTTQIEKTASGKRKYFVQLYKKD